MGWMQKLYETYENCRSLVGELETENKPPLMPIYHTTQQAQIEAVIDTDGNWRSARVLTDKKERTTLIPCTEKSASRTSSAVPHPLFDNLSYIAGDYPQYRAQKEDRYGEYIARLSDWCASPYSHPKVRAILEYLEKGTLMADLIQSDALVLDEAGRLPEKWEGKKEDTPLIFKAVPGDQAGAFVRFQVVRADGAEETQSRIWEDKTVWQSFIDYQNSLPADRDFCYVLGTKLPTSAISPKYIRRPGDGAKLISANDESGFTYRGRFETPSQAFSLGRETTEKAHNALKWLIPRQAYLNGDQVILAWNPGGGKVLDPCKNALDLLFELEPAPQPPTTGDEFAARFRKALAGYGRNLKGDENTCILGLDSATTGRLSIFYYRELQEKDLLDRIERWHKTCSWHFRAYPESAERQGQKGKPFPFEGAPAPGAIVKAAYGRQASDKLNKSTVQRLLPCIVDGASLPPDVMLCAARRASNPVALEDNDYGNTLAVACALVRKYYNDRENPKNINLIDYKERWKMALDTQETDRNYLFGRALAYAQQLENYALSLQGEKRSTNAERMQAAFSQHPAKMWKTLYQALSPYLLRLGSRGSRYRDELNEVISKIDLKNFTNDPLNEIYLLGYACQMQKFNEEMREASKNKKVDTDAEGEKKQ
ncbi:MAG: type I-C CRISPR-associated protein Cas8c/Csd1 [Clostridiales bacterium]|nr:type I-C CRISPR-associated protein Cas8c/Csd1 [Clostridiales bacterium]